MRKVRYSVAMSLDGFIAGPDGDVGWLPTELDMDWAAFMGRFDTVVMGRATYEFMKAHGGDVGGHRTYVCSRTLPEGEDGAFTVVADAAALVGGLRQESGKEIWLMGGGVLFAHLLDQGLVDVVEVALVPVLLGNGIPFLPLRERREELRHVDTRELGAGVAMLSYDVVGASGA